MAPRPKTVGGYGHRSALSHVEELRGQGLGEEAIRQQLRDEGYSAPRISQLLKATRGASAPAAVPQASLPAGAPSAGKRTAEALPAEVGEAEASDEARQKAKAGTSSRSSSPTASTSKPKKVKKDKNRKKEHGKKDMKSTNKLESKDFEEGADKECKGDDNKDIEPGPTPSWPVSDADRKTAAFTTWRQGHIQICGAAVATEKARVGGLPGGCVEKPALDELIGEVPEAVRACFPALLQLQGQIVQHEQVPNHLAKRVLARLIAITSEAEAFWEDQAGAGAASTAE